MFQKNKPLDTNLIIKDLIAEIQNLEKIIDGLITGIKGLEAELTFTKTKRTATTLILRYQKMKTVR